MGFLRCIVAVGCGCMCAGFGDVGVGIGVGVRSSLRFAECLWKGLFGGADEQAAAVAGIW